MPIVVEHLNKVYQTQQALRDVSCTFASGQIHGIVGRNGSGKTVLLRCLCGYTRSTSGKVLIDGKELGIDMAFPPAMGLLLDTPMFLPRFNGYENLMMLIGIRKKEKNEKKRLVEAALRQVGLQDQREKKVVYYSLGMRQRLGIAQALMEQPSLLILDEPFNGLDREGVREITDLLRNMREQGVTILLTSHYPDDLENLCDTVTRLDGGQIVGPERP